MLSEKYRPISNGEYDELFRGFDKEKAFDIIANFYYDGNFASTSKTEIDLLMFSFFMDALIQKNVDADNVLDYTKVADYEISQYLGITQERVRQLKIRKQVRYPVVFDWQKSLLRIKDNIRLESQKVVIPTSDPNLYLEIRNYVEGGADFFLDHLSSNVRHLSCG